VKRNTGFYNVGNAAGSFSLTPQAKPAPGAHFVGANDVLNRFPRGPYAPETERRFVTIDGPTGQVVVAAA